VPLLGRRGLRKFQPTCCGLVYIYFALIWVWIGFEVRYWGKGKVRGVLVELGELETENDEAVYLSSR